ncbi:unnamed protein product [Rhodiola kirilowii]
MCDFGQRGLTNPSAKLVVLLAERVKLHEELQSIENKQEERSRQNGQCALLTSN